jgi:hypothetical protein
LTTSFRCECRQPKPRRSGDGLEVCVECHKPKKIDKSGVDSDIIPPRPTKAEIEVIERKTRAMIALGEEVLNRLQELKAS